MSPRDLVYVGHMLDTAKKAISKTQSLSRDAYDADENLRLALTHLIQIIGEAGRQVSREFSEQHPEIPWADIVGMRHYDHQAHASGLTKRRRLVDHAQPKGHLPRASGRRESHTWDLRKSGILFGFEVCWAPDRAPPCRCGSRSSPNTEG